MPKKSILLKIFGKAGLPKYIDLDRNIMLYVEISFLNNPPKL